MEIPPPTGLVTLLTDFGTSDPYVGIMKGMVKRHHARAEVLDYCHGVPAQSVAVGAFYLRAAIGRFPTGTVHVAVVDPGVGTARRILCVCAEDCYWIGPDNGLLEAILPQPNDELGTREVRVVDLDAVKLRPTSRTFHGRDIMAPLAGMLASTRFGFRAVGPRVTDPVRLQPASARGHVLHVDAFGNLITDVPASVLDGTDALTILGRRVRVVGTYGDAKQGELVALVSSFGLVEIAERDGSAARELSLTRGDKVL